MIETDVLIIGAGLAGCTTALELAKQGVDVTLVSTGSNNSNLPEEDVSYPRSKESQASFANEIIRRGAGLSLPRAVAQLVEKAAPCIDALLIEELKIAADLFCESDSEDGDSRESGDCQQIRFQKGKGNVVVDAMLQRLSGYSNVSLLSDRTIVDLITLSNHSTKPTDIYKTPTCIGAYILDNETGDVVPFTAKETVVATGGSGEVFLNSATDEVSQGGGGLALAHRAGARLMNLDHIQFNPLALYLPNQHCSLLPNGLLTAGARLLSKTGQPFMETYHEAGSKAPSYLVASAMHMEILRSGADHLWLDLGRCDEKELRETFVGSYDECLLKGYDLTKQPLPVVPVPHFFCGGIAVDRVGRTSVQRLRAVGEVACTGVHGAGNLESVQFLEDLVWGTTCGVDLVSHVKKFAYYIPIVKELKKGEKRLESSLLRQDWRMVQQIMWSYVGPARDSRLLDRARHLLSELKKSIDSLDNSYHATRDLVALKNGVLTACLIVEFCLKSSISLGHHSDDVEEIVDVEADLSVLH